MCDEATVFLVDDDASVREALQWLFESMDLRVRPFNSATAFLDAFDPTQPGCLVADIRMPGMSGLELQETLRAQHVDMPIIFVTGHGDVPLCVRAFEGGAYAFVEKPVDHQLLLDHINKAIAKDFENRRQRHAAPNLADRLQLLTLREREIMDLLTAGKTMKQIAGDLEISIQTASKHRARVLEKMQVENDVELVRLILTADSA